MSEIIQWCNENNGFLTGILSVLTLIVSITAIVVSIHTARLPYKKRIVLSSDITMLLEANELTGQVSTQFAGITVNATNIGNRNVNIKFLGFAIRSSSGLQSMQTKNRTLGGTGTLEPTAVSTVEYTAFEIKDFGNLKPNTKVYCYALDTEGKKYLKYYGRAGKMIDACKKISEY